MKRLLLSAFAALAALAAMAQPRRITNEEFRYLPDTDTCTYILSGTVTTIRNAVAGHLYIKDETGEMQLYRIYGMDGECNFGKYDVHPGDTVTVMGHRSIYDFRVVEMKDARLLSFSNGPRHSAPAPKKAKGRKKRYRQTFF